MKEQQINLIDDTCSVTQARELLVSFFDEKIKHLNLQRFIMTEQYGYDPMDYGRQMDKFKMEKERLLEKLRSMNDPSVKLEINCVAEFKIKQKFASA
jgi:hypothetical protein